MREQAAPECWSPRKTLSSREPAAQGGSAKDDAGARPASSLQR
ncbi:hypothetical protein LA76x_0168 [Lysobacter antibioticus]|uniref:Uncharacterized protein n=1 Tax=Lysobacter antibioticus TaxID=84531 RepID=A0A0S2F471_LYSAN|nr:hypothetical protein LA76x_0168 [Lysobacter antibioticus]